MTKKRRSLFIVLGVVCVCVLSCAFVLTGCGNKHKFNSDEWTYDEDYHWHQCTKHEDDTDDVEDKANHDFVDVEVTKAATCKEAGEKTVKCSVCGYETTQTVDTLEHSWDDGKVTTAATCTEKGETTYTCTACGATKAEEIAALGHTFNITDATDITWDWTAFDEATFEGVTATATCSVCGDVTVNATVALSDDGTEYIATATFGGTAYTDSNPVSVTPTHVHKYVPGADAQWTWNSDNTACTTAGTCTNDDGLCEALTGTVYATISDGSSDADCTTPAYTWKIAMYDGTEVSTTTKVPSGEALGHNYVPTENEQWAFSNDYTSASVNGTCSRCDDTTGTVTTTDVTSATTEPTCGENSKTTYTAKYNGKEVLVSDPIENAGTATGNHTYAESSTVTWTWTEDEQNGGYGSATAEIACDVCGKTITENATLTAPDTNVVIGTWTATVTLTDGTQYVAHEEFGRVSLVHGEDINDGVAFVNDPDLEVVYDATNEQYKIVGTASVMTAEQAEVFGARVGDAYVLFSIKIEVGEKLIDTNGTTELYDNSDGEDAFVYTFGMRLEVCANLTYTISKDGSADETITIVFSTVDIPDAGKAEDIDFTPDDTVFDGYFFENQFDLTAAAGDNGEIVLSGTASIMTKDAALAFGGDEYATVGDAYVVYSFAVKAGETVIDLQDGWTWYNDTEKDDCLSVVMRLTTTAGYAGYEIIDKDGKITVYVISFSGIKLPMEAGKADDVGLEPEDTIFPYGEDEGEEYFFKNQFTITKTDGDNGEIILSGTASIMTKEAALAFGGDEYAVAGDAYVVYSFEVKVGETVIDLQDGWTWTNDTTEDDCLSIVMRLTTTEGFAKYAIIHADGTSTIYTIVFSGITLPETGDKDDVFFNPTDTTFTYGEEGNEKSYNFTNGNNTITATAGENGEIILSGTASIMTEEAALAFGGDEYAREGDAYIVYAIPVAVGETVIDLQDGWYWSNTGENAADDCLSIVMRLTTNEGLAAYAIVHTNDDGTVTVTVYTIVFSGIILPETDESGDGDGDTSDVPEESSVIEIRFDDIVAAEGTGDTGNKSVEYTTTKNIYTADDGTSVSAVGSDSSHQITFEENGTNYHEGLDDEVDFSTRLKMGGGYNSKYRYVELTVVDTCTVTIYVRSSSSSSVTVSIYENVDSNWTAMTGDAYSYSTGTDQVIEAYVVTLSEGTYRIGGSGNMYIYGIDIEYTSEVAEEG